MTWKVVDNTADKKKQIEAKCVCRQELLFGGPNLPEWVVGQYDLFMYVNSDQLWANHYELSYNSNLYFIWFYTLS